MEQDDNRVCGGWSRAMLTITPRAEIKRLCVSVPAGSEVTSTGTHGADEVAVLPAAASLQGSQRTNERPMLRPHDDATTEPRPCRLDSAAHTNAQTVRWPDRTSTLDNVRFHQAHWTSVGWSRAASIQIRHCATTSKMPPGLVGWREAPAGFTVGMYSSVEV